MGLMQHHAIVATTWNKEKAEAVQAWIDSKEESERRFYLRSAILTNTYSSIVMVPDGSKEGWDESDRGDQRRKEFLKRLAEDDYEDRSSPWNTVEVTFGELGTKIVYTTCEDRVS